MGTGNIERLDSTGLAKQMLGFMGIKGIGLQIVLTRQQVEPHTRYNQMQIAGS